MLTSGSRGRGWPSGQRVANKIGFLNEGLIFWRTTKNTVVVQLAIISWRIRVNYYTLAVIIPVV